MLNSHIPLKTPDMINKFNFDHKGVIDHLIKVCNHQDSFYSETISKAHSSLTTNNNLLQTKATVASPRQAIHNNSIYTCYLGNLAKSTSKILSKDPRIKTAVLNHLCPKNELD